MAEFVETSALSRRRHPELWPYFRRRDLLVCALARLEMLHGLVGSRHASLSEQLAAYPEPPLPDGLWARAEEVGRLVTEAGHRVRLIDVLIAAWAELGGHVLVHYDQRCEEIAAVTGQPARWVAPQGTL